MLDGLDEVSDLALRKLVKQAIENFILENRDTSKRNFNRFLITSRVAGYDVVAFADYLHYTIADLTPKQIEDFLPRWCRASVRRGSIPSVDTHAETEETLVREAEQMAQKLSSAVRMHQGVRKLAENPLLLTLLAVMQQNSIELPRQRVELYTVVTRTLLENRNVAKDLEPIPETQAIQRLGPIAFEMQETSNSFACQRNVRASLRETIKHEGGGTDEEIAQEVESFLSRIRERGGLFVIRTGDYFGFFHRTFQEYFAARHILNQIKSDKSDPNPWIAALVKKAHNPDDLWREPFLLAVAYQSGEDETVARMMLSNLLTLLPGADFASQVHDLLLAAECLIESKPLKIGATLEKQIAQQLLQTYEQAQQTGEFEVCSQIESVMRRWLLSLPGEAYRPALLVVLSETMTNTQQVNLQRATLTLLSMIAQELSNGPALIFDLLIPLLLALTGLPAPHLATTMAPSVTIPSLAPTFRQAMPSQRNTAVLDLNVVDLALTALSFLGQRGPAGLLLAEVRQYFKDAPEQLHQLAHLSLLCGTLITPAVVPLPEANFQRYSTAIEQWIALRDSYQSQHITAQDVATCLTIHEALLACAEEVCYPTATHLVNMNSALAHVPVHLWQQTCQDYLLHQLKSGLYVSYQENALLWTVLFSEQNEQKKLASFIFVDYSSAGVLVQRYAQRLLASLAYDLRGLRYLQNLRDLGYLGYLRNLRNLGNVGNLGNLRDLRNLRNLRNLGYLGNLRNLGYVGDLRNLRDLRDLRNLLLTKESAEKAMKRLSSMRTVTSANVVERIDLLAILMGRVLQIAEAEEMGGPIEREVQEIVEVAKNSLLAASSDTEVQEAALEVMRYLPARSANEITFVLYCFRKRMIG